MSELTFNIYAMAAPSTKAEYIALLDEALQIADTLSEEIDAMHSHIVKHDEKHIAA